MSDARLHELLAEFCAAVDLHPVEVLRRRQVLVKGIDVAFGESVDDPACFYATFQFGAVFPGRTLRVFQLMLEANVLVYAREDAVLGVDPDSGGVVLMLRCAYEQASGRWLADTLAHFAEHGQYWRENILECPDLMFEGVCSGDYQWIRA